MARRRLDRGRGRAARSTLDKVPRPPGDRSDSPPITSPTNMAEALRPWLDGLGEDAESRGIPPVGHWCRSRRRNARGRLPGGRAGSARELHGYSATEEGPEHPDATPKDHSCAPGRSRSAEQALPATLAAFWAAGERGRAPAASAQPPGVEPRQRAPPLPDSRPGPGGVRDRGSVLDVAWRVLTAV